MLEVGQHGGVHLVVDHGGGHAVVGAPARSADSVDVVLDVVRHIVVDDVLDLREVQTFVS